MAVGDGAFDQHQGVALRQTVAHEIGDQRSGALAEPAQARPDRRRKQRQERGPGLLHTALPLAAAAGRLAGEERLRQRGERALEAQSRRIEIEQAQDLQESGRGVARLAREVVGPAAPGQLLADILEERRRRRAVGKDAAFDHGDDLAIGEQREGTEVGRDVGDLVRPPDDLRRAAERLAERFGQPQPRRLGERAAAVDEIDRLEAPGRDGLQDRLQGYFSGSRAAEAVIAASENSPESSAGPQTGTSRTPSSSAERRSSSKLRSTEFHDPQREQESLQSA